MTDAAAARRTAGQRRLSGATAVLAAASLGGTGLVVATLARPATSTATVPGTVAQQPTQVTNDDGGYGGRSDDDGTVTFPQQAPQFSFQPPVARSSGS